MYVQGVFLSDIFEMLITPSILQISSFCKVVMTNQTGPFDNQQQSSWKKYYDMYLKQLEYRVLFAENSLIVDAYLHCSSFKCR